MADRYSLLQENINGVDLHFKIDWKTKWKNKLKTYSSLINFLLIIVLYIWVIYIYFGQMKPIVNKANEEMEKFEYINDLKNNVTMLLDRINRFCREYNVSGLCG
tara:strand:+ start:208 stop:519 length:312 start_codon:yes stop_codon:yes gene_type:complete